MFESLSIPTAIITYVALLFSLSVHEASHATAAYLLDDDTAARMGRMTINPIPHIDPIGTVLFPIMGLLFGGFFIGWAKPVPFDPSRLTRKLRIKVSAALISVAGPVSNLILAFTFVILTALAVRILSPDFLGRERLLNLALNNPRGLIKAAEGSSLLILLGLGGLLVQLNVLLALFNFIPLGPLDGAGVLGGILPDRYQYKYNHWRYHPGAWIALIVLMATGILWKILLPFLILVYAVLDPVAHLVLGA